jgi:SAM-dependent methyltransferase
VSAAARVSEAVIWHDVECGAYSADLETWSELAATTPGAVLELGCGTGRVALRLAGAGRRVSGLDSEPALLDALRERAAELGADVEAHRDDARDFKLGERFGLVAAPMQLAQLFDETGRRAMLAATARHLLPSGRAAFAIAAEVPDAWRAGPGSPPPTPDVRELDGWVFSSLPLGVDAEEGAITVRRLRQSVSPAGALVEHQHEIRLLDLSPEKLEREAGELGFRPVARHEIPPTPDHLGSVIVVMEADE